VLWSVEALPLFLLKPSLTHSCLFLCGQAKLSLRAAVACSQVPHPFLSQASITNLLDGRLNIHSMYTGSQHPFNHRSPLP
jgi:hypothetical protein